ncbi:histone-like nucleoid-structuring protein Lsr2 [Nonomuraea sp. NPDC046802]|uniref:Lsr2 family DNA-binding protein n=1 Tax=Nonomuraea sp. NPDC046802 TaxID=3154919 RepID=UPI0033CDDC01
MTAAVAERPTPQQGITPAYARALLLLTQGHQAKDAATATGIQLGRLVSLARQQGWTIHSATQRATDPTRNDMTPVLAPHLQALAGQFTERPRIVNDPDEPDEPYDATELLADAADFDDRHVKAALDRARQALDKLHTIYTQADEQRAAAVQRAAAKQAAADRITELEQQLAAAREQAKALGATTKRTTSGDRERDPAIRAWARSQGLPINERGRIPGHIRDQYNAAHPTA